jgi:rod shape-determining protein MreC
MNFFSFDLRKILIGMFLVAIPLVLLNVEHNPEDSAWYKKPFLWTLGLLQSSYQGLVNTVTDTTTTYLNLVDLKKKVQAIHDQNKELAIQLQQLDEYKIENERLRKLLNFQAKAPMELLAAQVIGQDVSSDHYTLFINKGTRHGLKKLQAVVSTEGVVGYVFSPQAYTSQVLLITDRSTSIDAIVQRTRARGIVSGRTASSARLRYLERADHVQAGDRVVTSGLQGYFPKGFPIGTVTAVKKTDHGISLEAYVQPLVNPNQLEEVFVVLHANDADFEGADLAQITAPESAETADSSATPTTQSVESM